MPNEAIVLLAREFGWTFDQIGKLTLQQLNNIIGELTYQKRLEDYAESYRFAFLASVICNLLSKEKVDPEDFIGLMPKRDDAYSEEDLFLLAKQTRRHKKPNG